MYPTGVANTYIVPQPAQQQQHSVLERSPRYRTCCCHVTTGAKVVSVVIVVVATIGMLLSLGELVDGIPYAAGRFAGAMLHLVFVSIVAALILFGIRKQRAAYMIPYLVLNVIQQVVLFIVIILLIIFFASGAVISAQSAHDRSGDKQVGDLVMIMSALLLALFIISFVINFLFFVIIFKAYRYLRDKAVYGMHFGAPPVYIATA